MKINWSSAMQSLVLIRLGQKLGTDSPLARAIHAAATLFLELSNLCP